MSTLSDAVQARKKQQARDKAMESCGQAIGLLVFGILFLLVGWNYGITEVVQALGGPDANVNVGVAAASFLFLGVLKNRAGQG